MISKGLVTVFLMFSAMTALLTVYTDEIAFDPQAAFVSTLGWLLYNVVVWVNHKDPMDKKGQKFKYKLYLQERAENILLSAVVAILVAYFGPQVDAANFVIPGTQIRSGDAFYLSTGAIVQKLHKLKWK